MKHTKFMRISSIGMAVALPMIIGIFFLQISYAAENKTGLSDGNIITVTTAVDELNSDGDCALREAVQAANSDTAIDACIAGNGWDTISIPAGNYELTSTQFSGQ